MRKQPTTALPLTLRHVVRGLPGVFDPKAAESFERAFYLILAACARLLPGRDEVILPDYSVPTVIHAVRLAGLKPVYCDIRRGTLNMDPESMEKVAGDRTLAVVPFHMFGFPCAMDRALDLGRATGAFVIEDACQAIGASLSGRRLGSIGDAGFFSLCKGKIISTFRGGVVTTNDPRIAEAVREISKSLPPVERWFRLAQPLVMAALSLSMRPWFYGALYPLVARFKSTTLHESFHPSGFTRYGAAEAAVLLGEIDRWIDDRRRNGGALAEGLAGDDGLIVPEVIPGAKPSYNHLPIVFTDRERMIETERRLWERGIDTARMYERPVHHIYSELGYPLEPDPFPEATFVAPRLLTLPSHPYLRPKDIRAMIETVRSTG